MVRLTCPRCATTFEPSTGAAPRCPSCGYSPGGTAYTPPPQQAAPTYGYPGQPPMAPPAYAPPPGAQGAYVATTNGMATASMVLGIIGFCVPLLSIVALILGMSARKQIQQTREQGEGMATAGIVMGAIGTALTALYLIFYVFMVAFVRGI